MPATVVSAGRGLCFDGLDPNYPIPQGIAAWDVVRFTIPSGVTGCFIPVVVQIGNVVSNLATISSDPSGAACTPAVSTLPAALVQKLASQTGVSIKTLGPGRVTGMSATAAGVTAINKLDSGNAAFLKYSNVPASEFTAEVNFPENVCTIKGFPVANGGLTQNGDPIPIVPQAAITLEAGPALTVTGPSGTRSIVRQMAGTVVAYKSTILGNATAGNYLDPGHYTVTGPAVRMLSHSRHR